jgi:hypothetical protein
MNDDLSRDVSNLKTAVYGDQSDPSGWPGIMAEQKRMGMEQARTNEILLELRNSVTWIIRLLVSGFVTALIAAFFTVIAKYGGV